MVSWASVFTDSVVRGLAGAAVPADVGRMTAYMRHQFPFLGVKAPACKAVVRAALAAAGPPADGDEDEVTTAMDALWERPEREHRYAGRLLAGRFAPLALARLHRPRRPVDHERPMVGHVRSPGPRLRRPRRPPPS